MTERKRDLTGFGGSLPLPPPRVPAEAKPVIRRSPGSTPPERARRPRPEAKRRITLSLPVETASLLKTASETEGRFYLDLILAAFVEHGPAIRQQVDLARAESSVGIRPFRKRTTPGRVQVALLIPAADLAMIDDAARQAGVDRSTYVGLLLTHR
jgi:hypothetical protein